ncbi:MAG: SGNH/GDSL hydrolase family protein [Bacteroidota bacterium]
MQSFLPYLFLLFCFGCLDDDDAISPPTQMEPPASAINITYLALGDSYTIGTSVEAEDRWPTQLAAALVADSIRVTTLDYVATNGWTTGELINGIASRRDELAPTYDLVSLLIGVNNQYRGMPLPQYQEQFEELLRTAIEFAGGDTSRVFVVSIPDYAYTPFGNGSEEISNDLTRFNAAANFIVDDYGIPFYNITPISQEGLTAPALVAADNLHPSGKQYGRWVREVLRVPVLGLLSQ